MLCLTSGNGFAVGKVLDIECELNPVTNLRTWKYKYTNGDNEVRENSFSDSKITQSHGKSIEIILGPKTIRFSPGARDPSSYPWFTMAIDQGESFLEIMTDQEKDLQVRIKAGSAIDHLINSGRGTMYLKGPYTFQTLESEGGTKIKLGENTELTCEQAIYLEGSTLDVSGQNLKVTHNATNTKSALGNITNCNNFSAVLQTVDQIDQFFKEQIAATGHSHSLTIGNQQNPESCIHYDFKHIGILRQIPTLEKLIPSAQAKNIRSNLSKLIDGCDAAETAQILRKFPNGQEKDVRNLLLTTVASLLLQRLENIKEDGYFNRTSFIGNRLSSVSKLLALVNQNNRTDEVCTMVFELFDSPDTQAYWDNRHVNKIMEQTSNLYLILNQSGKTKEISPNFFKLLKYYPNSFIKLLESITQGPKEVRIDLLKTVAPQLLLFIEERKENMPNIDFVTNRISALGQLLDLLDKESRTEIVCSNLLKLFGESSQKDIRVIVDMIRVRQKEFHTIFLTKLVPLLLTITQKRKSNQEFKEVDFIASSIWGLTEILNMEDESHRTEEMCSNLLKLFDNLHPKSRGQIVKELKRIPEEKRLNMLETLEILQAKTIDDIWSLYVATMSNEIGS